MSAKRPKEVKLSKVFATAREIFEFQRESGKFSFCCHNIEDAAIELVGEENYEALSVRAKMRFEKFRPTGDLYAWWPAEEYTARVIALTWCELEAKEEERTSAL